MCHFLSPVVLQPSWYEINMQSNSYTTGLFVLRLLTPSAVLFNIALCPESTSWHGINLGNLLTVSPEGIDWICNQLKERKVVGFNDSTRCPYEVYDILSVTAQIDVPCVICLNLYLHLSISLLNTPWNMVISWVIGCIVGANIHVGFPNSSTRHVPYVDFHIVHRSIVIGTNISRCASDLPSCVS